MGSKKVILKLKDKIKRKCAKGSFSNNDTFIRDKGKIKWSRPQVGRNIVFYSIKKFSVQHFMGFPGSSNGKESTCNAGDPSLTPESGRLLGEGNGYSLQYSCLENSTDRGAWRAAVHGISESDMTE